MNREIGIFMLRGGKYFIHRGLMFMLKDFIFRSFRRGRCISPASYLLPFFTPPRSPASLIPANSHHARLLNALVWLIGWWRIILKGRGGRVWEGRVGMSGGRGGGGGRKGTLGAGGQGVELRFIVFRLWVFRWKGEGGRWKGEGGRGKGERGRGNGEGGTGNGERAMGCV